ncbi:MAG: glycosyltransferase family 4 protein [Pyrinomonas methylaliphatogenes]|jgi:glycosyltransferase involved in cell wall biosynthesis|nr:glycosyltransferase family 4 protein [Pyrinomonas methylaliphatogenes]
MTVLLVGNFLSESGGTHGVCEELAVRLEDAGCRVITVSRSRARLRRLCEMVGAVWHHQREYDVAHVDLFSGDAFFWAEAVCWTLRRARKPYVLTLHGGRLPQFAHRWPRRVRRLLASAAIVTAPSNYLRERMLPYCARIVVQPNALELARYEFRARAQPKPRLVWLRAFHEIYNPALAVGVIRRLVPDYPALRLLMAGPDKGDGSLERARRLAGQNGFLDGHIAFRGSIDKRAVPRFLQEGDVFLNTANTDNTPVSVIEAMACGLCVVSTNVDGLPFLLEDERDALLVAPGDAQAMSAAVRRILTEPGLALRLSENARRKVEAFDWSMVLPRWLSIFEEAMIGRSNGCGA